MTEDEATEARRVERDPLAGNPNTEFRLGFRAGAELRGTECENVQGELRGQLAKVTNERDASRAVKADRLAAQHSTALAAQNEHYTKHPMNDDAGEGES